MNANLKPALLLLAASLLSCGNLIAQQSPAAPPAAQTETAPKPPRPMPTNLKVLPQGMTGDEVRVVMRQYNNQLGVRCEFCHEQDPKTGKRDFPSDANPVKQEARTMITMTDDINTKYLSQFGSGASVPVTCGTCHRGQAQPSDAVPKDR